MDVCRICANSEAKTHYTAREMMFGLRERFDYFQCPQCRCLQISDFPEDMSRYYPEHYYSMQVELPHSKGALSAHWLALESWIRLHVNNRVFGASRRTKIFDWMRSCGCTYDSAILDVGCGRGKLLHELQLLGFRNLTGADPFVSEDLSHPNGVRIFKASLEALDGLFALIMMHHTFEHIATPRESMRAAAARLQPGGFLLLRIPVIDCFAWRNYGVNWFSLDAPRHFFLHSPKSIALLAEQTGFEIQSIVYDSGAHQFWGSEQYLRDIPHRSPRSYEDNPAASIFSRAQIKDFERQSRNLNAAGDGDAACFYLRRFATDTTRNSRSFHQVPMKPTHQSAEHKRKLPSITVSIRSYKRYPSLLKMLEVLRAQDHPDFEIVVIEQSDLGPEQRARLDAISAEDPRVRIIYSEPLGVGGSREAAWRNATKEIVVILDDDDLPLGKGFLSGHAVNYLDPSILAVSCRHVYQPDEVCGYNRHRARRRCLRYNLWGYPNVFCRFDERIESVDWVHGSGSIRRSVIERVGGWDPKSTDQDEHPLCMALLDMMKPGERMVFDPSIKLLRRKEIPGGASVRFDGSRRIYDSWIRYYHDIVMKHRPIRSAILYPIFPLASTFSATRWIWKDSMIHRGHLHRLLDSFRTVGGSPIWYCAELARQVSTRLKPKRD